MLISRETGAAEEEKYSKGSNRRAISASHFSGDVPSSTARIDAVDEDGEPSYTQDAAGGHADSEPDDHNLAETFAVLSEARFLQSMESDSDGEVEVLEDLTPEEHERFMRAASVAANATRRYLERVSVKREPGSSSVGVNDDDSGELYCPQA